MSKKLTTEEFIKKAKKVHGNKYDYSKVKYENSRKKVIIVCKEHKNFQQKPHCHLLGRGCQKCGKIIADNKERKSTEQFIKESIQKHGYKYDYSKVEYTGCNKKVIIICRLHGQFLKNSKDHLIGQGCPKCSKEKVIKELIKTTEEFIQKAKKVHKNKYDYSKTDYVSAHKKVIVICKKHGPFAQSPNSHLRGNGCNKCSIIKNANRCRSTLKDFVKKAKKIHGNKYDYNQVVYQKNNTEVIIVCKKHGPFVQQPSGHLQGKGCSHCVNKGEGKVKELLLKYFKDWTIIPNKKLWDKYKRYNHRRYCDFWLEKDDVKVIVEYDGQQHFRPVSFGCRDIKLINKRFKIIQKKDKLDKEFCAENNIILHRIKYDEDKEQSIKMLLKKVG